MKKLVIITILALALLTACATNNNDSAAKDIAEELKNSEQTDEETTEEPTEELTEESTEVIETTSNSITEAQEISELPEIDYSVEELITVPAEKRTRMYQFLDTYSQRVNGYDFFIGLDKYHYKNDRFKIILNKAKQVNSVTFGELNKPLFYYDTIYVDRVSKTAFAYCEGHDSKVNKQCADLEIYDLAYPLPYLETNKALPHDILFNYLDFEPDYLEANKYYVKGRLTTTVRFEGDPRVEISMDPTTGLPLRVDRLKGNVLVDRLDFEKLASNTVRDVDVYHRTKDEIPSHEVFYK